MKKIPLYHFPPPGEARDHRVGYPYGESEEEAVKKLQYDLYYIRNYSLKLDAMVVLNTSTPCYSAVADDRLAVSARRLELGDRLFHFSVSKC